MQPRTVVLALVLALALSAAFSLVAWSGGEARRAALCEDALERQRRAEALQPGPSGALTGRSLARGTGEDRLVQAVADVRSYCR
jgi:hypothetical protein